MKQYYKSSPAAFFIFVKIIQFSSSFSNNPKNQDLIFTTENQANELGFSSTSQIYPKFLVSINLLLMKTRTNQVLFSYNTKLHLIFLKAPEKTQKPKNWAKSNANINLGKSQSTSQFQESE